MDKERILRFLGDDWNAMNAAVREALGSDIPLLNSANDNILSHGGKMLRPMLSLLMFRACGGRPGDDTSCRYAAAAELLHNATLLHDDVADASSERRGYPTTSSILGDNASVLLGDFWLVRAVDVILSTEKFSSNVVKLFAKTLGDLAEGEMLQLQKASEGDTTHEDYFRIIYSKTASLFEAACVSAAIAADAPQEYVEAARSYGAHLGIAFQIKDDILDYTASDSLGKPVGIDLLEKKITLPLLASFESVDAETESRMRNLVTTIDTNPANIDILRRFVAESDGIGKATASLDSYVAAASDALGVLPDSEARTLLEELAGFTAYRNK